MDALKSEGNELVKELMPFCAQYTLNVICGEIFWNYFELHLSWEFGFYIFFHYSVFLESAMGVALDKMEPDIVEKYKKAVYDMGHVVLYRYIPIYYNKNNCDAILFFKVIKFWAHLKNAQTIHHQFYDEFSMEDG